MMKSWMEAVYNTSPPALQNALIAAYRYARRPWDYGPAFRREHGWLAETEHWSRAELDAWQGERLQALVAHAYANVPAYRARYDAAGVRPADIRSLADLSRLPMIDKAEVRATPAAFRARNARQFHPVALHTSGTTGTPFHFDSDRATERIESAFYWRHKRWGGARLREPMISLGGRLVVPLRQQHPPFWRYSRADGLLWLSAFHMTPAHLDLYLAHVQESGIRFLKGYPSNLFIFARHLARRGVRLPMRAVYTGSEPLFGFVRDLLEDRFACRVFDWYGVSERVVTASQCAQHGDYHVHAENCLVEIVRGAAPAPPDTPGEVVGTALSNYAMPLIRYRTGDLSAWAPAPCPCGRALPTIRQVQTKCEDILTTADGRWLSPSVLTHPFKPVQGVERSQIVQDAPGHLTINVVAGARFDRAQEALLREGLAQRLGPDMGVAIVRVADVPRDSSGKYRWVVSRVPAAYNEWLARARAES